MKRSTRRTVVYGLAAGMVALLPAIVGIGLTYRAALGQAEEDLQLIAEQVSDRVYQVLWAAEGALADVIFKARDGCTEELILAMRNKATTLYTLRGMAFITAGNLLTCTSYGQLEPPIQVGDKAIEFIRPPGSLVFFTPPISTPFSPGVSIVAGHELKNGGTLVVLIAPDALVEGVGQHVLGTNAYVRITILGTPLAVMGRIPTVKPYPLIAREDVGLFDVEVEAGATRDWALADWRESLGINALIAILVGALLSGGVAYLAHRRLETNEELKDALDNEEFEVHYQPVIDLQARRCVGAEALIRWRHPKRGLVAPDLFIAMAEDSGEIIPITRWMMQRIGHEMGDLLRSDPHFHIGINLAPKHFDSLEVVDDAKAAAVKSDIPLSQLMFEITERGLVDDAGCRNVLDALRAQGCEVAIDDFGTGYSSLAYLEKFRLDYLKIDKAFVSTIGTDAPSAALAPIIINLAKSLGLGTIAEGVETGDQARFLRQHGVDNVQGWFYSKSLPADEFIAFAERYRAAGSTA